MFTSTDEYRKLVGEIDAYGGLLSLCIKFRRFENIRQLTPFGLVAAMIFWLFAIPFSEQKGLWMIAWTVAWIPGGLAYIFVFRLLSDRISSEVDAIARRIGFRFCFRGIDVNYRGTAAKWKVAEVELELYKKTQLRFLFIAADGGNSDAVTVVQKWLDDETRSQCPRSK